MPASCSHSKQLQPLYNWLESHVHMVCSDQSNAQQTQTNNGTICTTRPYVNTWYKCMYILYICSDHLYKQHADVSLHTCTTWHQCGLSAEHDPHMYNIYIHTQGHLQQEHANAPPPRSACCFTVIMMSIDNKLMCKQARNIHPAWHVHAPTHTCMNIWVCAHLYTCPHINVWTPIWISSLSDAHW